VCHGGVTFGLIDESDAERGDRVGLYPDRLGFTEPWDGLYST
jgi:formate hydrogenlyase regulatory protein HycA